MNYQIESTGKFALNLLLFKYVSNLSYHLSGEITGKIDPSFLNLSLVLK